MQCDEFELQWNDRLDARGRPWEEPALAEHVEQCAPCRAWAAPLAAALSLADRARRPAADGRRVGRIVAEWQDENRGTRLVQRWAAPAAALVALAAVVAMVAVALPGWVKPKVPALGPGALAEGEGIQAGGPEGEGIEAGADLAQLAGEARERMSHLAQAAGRSVAEAMPEGSATELAALPEVPRPLESSVARVRGAARGVEPVASSAFSALGALRGVLPRGGMAMTERGP
jgi:hypothetical protein